METMILMKIILSTLFFLFLLRVFPLSERKRRRNEHIERQREEYPGIDPFEFFRSIDDKIIEFLQRFFM